MMTFRAFPVMLVLFSLVGTAYGQPGGWQKAKVDDPAVVAAAEFAVEAQRAKNEKVSLKGITSARSQLVAGMNYEVTMRVTDRSSEKPVVRKAVAVVYEDLDGNRKLTSWTWAKPAAAKKVDTKSASNGREPSRVCTSV